MIFIFFSRHWSEMRLLPKPGSDVGTNSELSTCARTVSGKVACRCCSALFSFFLPLNAAEDVGFHTDQQEIRPKRTNMWKCLLKNLSDW